jgi:hypothetical protein
MWSLSITLYLQCTVKPVHAVTSIKQLPVLKGYLFLVLPLEISYELNLFYCQLAINRYLSLGKLVIILRIKKICCWNPYVLIKEGLIFFKACYIIRLFKVALSDIGIINKAKCMRLPLNPCLFTSERGQMMIRQSP